jgi:DNA-binding Lrp family transcriptional regulator
MVTRRPPAKANEFPATGAVDPNNHKGNSGRQSGIRASKNADELALRRQKCLDLRLQGMQLREIAQKVGVSAMVVGQDIKKLINDQLSPDDVQAARALEEARLDKLLGIALGVAENLKADPELRLKAIDRVVRISNQRATLLGLNMPTRVDMTVTERTQQDIELQELINEAQARNTNVASQLKAEINTDDPAGA